MKRFHANSATVRAVAKDTGRTPVATAAFLNSKLKGKRKLLKPQIDAALRLVLRKRKEEI